MKTKTREEIADDLIKLEKEIKKRDVLVFDDDWLHFFEKWRKEKNKYQDLNIEEVEFEIKRIHSDNKDDLVCRKRMGFTPKTILNGTINWFSVKDLSNIKGLFIIYPDTIKKTTMDLIKQAVDKKNTGKSEKLIPIKKGDVLVSFKLSVGIVKIYNSDEIAYCNEAIDILTPKENIYNKYLAYNCMTEYLQYGTQTNNGLTLNDDDKKKIKIYIPKPYKTYSSYDIQKILVEFLEDNKNTSDKYRKKLDSVDKDIKEMEDNLIPAIFSKNDDYIKKMWIKWNTDPVEPRKKEDMVDFTLEDIEFEEKKIDEFVNSKGGSSKYNKKYYQDENNFGDYPLMTGSLNIVGYIKPISQDDIIKEESISYNKDNDGGSKAFYHNKPYIVGGHHYALLIKDKYKKDINIKYFYYIMMEFFNKNKFYQSKQPVANIGIIKEKNIKIPKPIKTKTKEYSSYEVQKAIVSFIDRFYRWKATIKSVMSKMREILDEMDEGFLYKTFKGRE